MGGQAHLEQRRALALQKRHPSLGALHDGRHGLVVQTDHLQVHPATQSDFRSRTQTGPALEGGVGYAGYPAACALARAPGGGDGVVLG
jgi:hypothetical protein